MESFELPAGSQQLSEANKDRRKESVTNVCYVGTRCEPREENVLWHNEAPSVGYRTHARREKQLEVFQPVCQPLATSIPMPSE